MMKDIYGRTLGTPLARYSHDSQCWRTCEDTSLWDLPMSLETLPPWGMTLGGVLFELQTPGHLMGGQEFSSLPTPRAQARDIIYNRADYHCNLEEALAMLPTPKAINNENQQNLDKYGPNLGMVLMPDQYDWPMLPTPTARDYRDFQIEAAKHRPEATDTLNPALAHHLGVNTDRPLLDGSPLPDRRHNRLFTEPNVSDLTPDSLSG